jgi:hypothetical protein
VQFALHMMLNKRQSQKCRPIALQPSFQISLSMDQEFVLFPEGHLKQQVFQAR